MKSAEFITEDINKDYAIMDKWVTGYSQDARMLKKISDFDKYQKPSGKAIYRMWTIPPTAALKLLDRHKHWDENRPAVKPLVLKPKRKVISFSWSTQGAQSVTDDGYEHNGVQILVKKKVLPNSLFFNLYQWGLKNPKYSDANLIKREKELIVLTDPYYLTIDPSEIVNRKQATKEIDNWSWG